MSGQASPLGRQVGAQTASGSGWKNASLTQTWSKHFGQSVFDEPSSRDHFKELNLRHREAFTGSQNLILHNSRIVGEITPPTRVATVSRVTLVATMQIVSNAEMIFESRTNRIGLISDHTLFD
jgi:hypothetical protein